MTIFNGQFGKPASDVNNEEETVGAFTVANLNDTDNDGMDDVDDGNVEMNPITGGISEVDLMALEIAKPVDVAPDGSWLTLTVSGNAKLWAIFTKGEEITQRTFTLSELPKVVWVEATAASTSLRDITITATYRGEADTVKATAVWAEQSAVAHDTMNADDLFNDDLLPWQDTTEPPRDALEFLGWVGLRPIDALGARTIILIRFTVSPFGIGAQPGVKFDITRQLEEKQWLGSFAAPNPVPGKTLPPGDVANDDPPDETDESKAPNGNSHEWH